jgi:hypothetical protein
MAGCMVALFFAFCLIGGLGDQVPIITTMVVALRDGVAPISGARRPIFVKPFASLPFVLLGVLFCCLGWPKGCLLMSCISFHEVNLCLSCADFLVLQREVVLVVKMVIYLAVELT